MIEALPRLLLRLEGAAIGVSAIAVYFWADYPWWLLVVLALAPDLSFLGYAAGPRIGALAYGLKYPTRFEDTHLQRV